MKNCVYKLLIIFLVLPSFARAGFLFVGNGGEGIQVNGQLYTRDLYDYDLHLNPWFGTSIDSRILTEVRAWDELPLNETQKLLLARKLTDVETVHRDLGRGLLMALRYFDWSFTSESVTLIEPDELRKMVLPEQRVAIANRYYHSIQLNKVHFDRLNDENKMALILHEAIYALMPAVTGPKKGLTQSLSGTRLLTSRFFSKKAIQEASFKEIIAKQMRFHDSVNTPDTPPPAFYESERRLRLESYEGPESSVRYVMDIKDPLEPKDLLRALQRFCAANFNAPSQSLLVQAVASPRRFLEADVYIAPNCSEQYKLEFKVEKSKPQKFYLSTETCIADLQEEVRNILSADFSARSIFQIQGQDSPSPEPHCVGQERAHTPWSPFVVSGDIFRSNGKEYCRFRSLNSFTYASGRKDVSGLKSYLKIPERLTYAGLCAEPPIPPGYFVFEGKVYRSNPGGYCLAQGKGAGDFPTQHALPESMINLGKCAN